MLAHERRLHEVPLNQQHIGFESAVPLPRCCGWWQLGAGVLLGARGSSSVSSPELSTIQGTSSYFNEGLVGAYLVVLGFISVL